MLVPIAGSVLGEAWCARESRFELSPFPPELDLPGDANRLRRKLRWPKLGWQLCIPILDSQNRARFTVQISGDAKLRAEDPRLEDAITEMENSVKEFFNLIMQQLSELEDDHGLEEHHF